MIINVEGVWALAVDRHNIYVEKCAEEKMAEIRKTEPSSLTRNLVLWFAKSQLASILDPKETSFTKQRRIYDNLFPKGYVRTHANELFTRIFDYAIFSKKDNLGKHWCAYDLCEYASADICPYCHLVPNGFYPPNPTNDLKGFRPNLDHHYPHADYPFLALSLGNLIPCCGLCNGPQMKHVFDTSNKPILHPQRDPECIEFSLQDVAAYEKTQQWTLQGPETAYRIELTATSHINLVENSMEAFQLDGRYNNLAEKRDVLNRLRELRRPPNQTMSLFHFVAIVDYRSFPEKGYRKQIKGKLIHDLHKQFCEPLLN